MKQEHVICSSCNIGLPRTHYHLVENNPVEQIFWGRVKIEKATSFFLFQKGSKYQKLMHHLKYKNRPEVGVELGKRFAAELQQVNYLGDIDAIIPVPLHPKKLRKRGYNQSMAIVEGMAVAANKEIIEEVLFRRIYSETQTRKGRYERYKNMNELFAVKDEHLIENKHVLLVDDIVTTGSTIEACVEALLQVKNVKVSIATLAFTSI